MNRVALITGALAGIILAAAAQAQTQYQFPTTPWNAYAPGNVECGKLLAANMNVTTDQAIPISVPTTNYEVSSISVSGASISLSTAAGGVYTAASKGGTAVVAAGQAYSTLTAAAANAAGSVLLLTLNAPTALFNAKTLYLSLTTGQGAAATANVRVYCKAHY